MKSLVLLFIMSGAFVLQGQNLLDEQDKKTGPWKVEYPNGKTLYEAEFQKGKPVGEMIRYYESGSVRARMMFESQGDKNFTRMFYKNGKQAAEGWYMNKEKDSVWTYFSEFDGTVRIREPYQNGNLHGLVKCYYSSGIVSEEVSWQQNRKNGLWKQYYQNGSMRLKSRYENDLLNGSYEVFYADSTIKVRGTYLDNHKNETWSFFDETGSEAYTIEYLLGRAVDQRKYQQLMQDSLKRFELIAEPEFIQHF